MKKFRKLTSWMLVLCMVLIAALSMTTPLTVMADETASTTHYLAFASDRHSNENAISEAMSTFNSATEYVGLIGDMVNDTDSYKTSDVLGEVQQTFPDAGLSSTNVDILYGSHDENATDDAGIMNDTTGLIYECPDGADADSRPDYYVYAISFANMGSASSSATSASAFESWVKDIDESIPVFVVCHRPMHANRGDNAGGYTWAKALNYAATGSEEGTTIIRNVIFLHGHNHTTEENKEFYYAPNDTVYMSASNNDKTGTATTVEFTYITAGYLNANTHATQVTITDNEISFNRSGTELGSVDRVKNDGYSISLDQSKATMDLVDESTQSVALKATVAYPDGVDEPTVTWKSSDESVATVSASEEDSKSATVTAGAKGSATITAEITTGDGSTKSAQCKITVKDSGADSATYTLATTVTSGNKYLIVSNGYELTNSDGTLGAETVEGTAGDETITTSGNDTLWTFTTNNESAGTGYGDYQVSNNDTYIARTSGSSAVALTTKAELSSSKNTAKYYVWSYTDSNTLTQNGGSTSSGKSSSSSSSTSTYYAYYNEDKGAFYTSTTSANTYLYEVSESENDEYGISLDQSKATMDLSDESIKSAALKATVAYPDGVDEPTVTWKSSDESVATVSASEEDSKSATVTAVAAGSATITAEITTGDGSTKSAQCKITVKDSGADSTTYTLATSVTSGKEYLIVSNGYELTNSDGTLGAEAVEGTAGDETITTSGNDTLWTFTTNTDSDGTDYGDYQVSNNDTYIARTSGSSAVALTTKAELSSSKNTAKYYVWSYTDSNTLTQNGGSTSSGKSSSSSSSSTSTYYAYYNEDKGAFYTSTTSANTYLYEVSDSEEVAVTGVTLDKTTADLTVGNETTLTATISPENATNKTVTWSSSDEGVATVTGGTVKGLSAGTATITATTEDGGHESTCIVTVTGNEEEEEEDEITDPTVTPESVSVSSSSTSGSSTICVGQVLTVNYTPNGFIRSCTVETSDENIASVDTTSFTGTMGTTKAIKVTANAAGSATITISSSSIFSWLSSSATVTVTVKDHSFTTYTDNGDGTKTANCDNGCGATKTITEPKKESSESSVIELGSINTNGQNYATTSRARTIQSYKADEQSFTVDTSKAEGSRYAVIGFDSDGSRILDTGWRTSTTYDLPSSVVTYRLLFSYSDNRTLTNADLLLFDSELTITDKSSVIELGSINTNGQNYATTSRARTIQSYKADEQSFTVDTSKAEGSRYAVIGFDSDGSRILDTGWRTDKTYDIPDSVATYRLLFSYSDNRTLTNADLLLFDSELTITDKSSVIELGSINTNGADYATKIRARTIGSYEADHVFTVDTSKAEGSRYAVIGFDSDGNRILDTGWRTDKTYDIPDSVATYRLLFSYSDNRTLTNADLLLFDSELTVTEKSSVIEFGSINTNGADYATKIRARTIGSYEADQVFTVDTSKAEGSRYAVIGFDSDGNRILDTGWRTDKTYDIPDSVATYRLLFSYTDNRTLTNADLLLFDSELTISDI